MKIPIAVVFFILFSEISLGQYNQVSLKLGLIDPESFGEYGYNVEIDYRYHFKGNPKISLGTGAGVGKKNTFPQIFQDSFLFAENNDVTQEIDNHIRSLTFNEALNFSFNSYNVNYVRLLLFVRLFRVLGITATSYSGLFIRDENTASFDIYNYTLDNDGRIADYRSNFLVDQLVTIGWPLGIEFQKEIMDSYQLLADVNYGIPFNRQIDLYVNFFLRLGIARNF
jgi:hypothetical protein